MSGLGLNQNAPSCARIVRPDTPWERVLFEPGGQGDSKAATVKARVGVGVVEVGGYARVIVGIRRRMERRGMGRCIFAMMMREEKGGYL